MSPLILHGAFGSRADERPSQDASSTSPEDIRARWQEAQENLAKLRTDSIPSNDPLRILVNVDVPRLLQEATHAAVAPTKRNAQNSGSHTSAI